MVNQRAVAVVLDGRRLLVIQRFRDGRHYSVLPGGGVEDGESCEHAAVRELAEETSLVGTIVRRLATINDGGRDATYFLVSIPDPSVQPRLGGPEATRQSSTNRYRPTWIDGRQLGLTRHDLQPEVVRPLITELVG
ncbi:NUDIX domain-containing protein [Microlunatus soli]|uniref:NUDIX domain-containing protein n=1 Tax=Microlunatus soli TaxID=630515 RepID=A0A1H1NJW4_9ACTN|nr:NUDIX domain-containing protein [Microlunatus soli]SDR99306.1 NUDIX domain-containing protein [Microlunatus soli]